MSIVNMYAANNRSTISNQMLHQQLHQQPMPRRQQIAVYQYLNPVYYAQMMPVQMIQWPVMYQRVEQKYQEVEHQDLPRPKKPTPPDVPLSELEDEPPKKVAKQTEKENKGFENLYKRHKNFKKCRSEAKDFYLIMFSKMRVTKELMMEWGYPFFENVSSPSVTIKSTVYEMHKKMWIQEEDRTRRCVRCNEEYSIDLNGESRSRCRYHNRGFVYNEGKENIRLHSCCRNEVGISIGCKHETFHVSNQLFSSELSQFIRTPSPRILDSRSRKMYAIDCEMVYTTAGPALARLSVVNMKGKLVLDMIVKPLHAVIDANTEFSGLTIEQVNASKNNLETCREELFKLVNSETILIGHSLESDFKALRLVHHNVVDTSLLFKNGPHKPALRNLTKQHLGRNIQSDNVNTFGHSSAEDAKACIDLVKEYITCHH